MDRQLFLDLRRFCMSSSSRPHPQNMLEKPLTLKSKWNMCLYCEAFINLFKLCCWHTPDAPKIACIGQLPAPLVHSRGHQKWILHNVYSSFRRFNFVNFCHQSMRNAILLLQLPCLWYFWPHLMRSSVLCVNVSGAHETNPHTHLMCERVRELL